MKAKDCSGATITVGDTVGTGRLGINRYGVIALATMVWQGKETPAAVISKEGTDWVNTTPTFALRKVNA